MAVKRFRTLDEIEADRNERERKEFKEKVSGDIKDVFDDFFKPEKKPVKKKKNHFLTFLIFWLLLLSFLIVLDIILGSILLIKLFIKSIF